MKIFKIVFLALLTLGLIACGGVFIFIETFDTDQYLPQITGKASLALGRPVFIGRTLPGLSLRGITLDAGPVIIAGDSGLIQEPFVKVDRVRISLDARSFIRFMGQGTLNDCFADIDITDGVIKDFDVLKIVLAHARGAFGNIDNLLNGRLKDALGARDIVIEKAKARFLFHDKTVFIDGSSIKTNIFEFTAKGRVDQGLNTNMQTVLYLNEDVSAALVNEFEGLKYFMDDTKRVAVDASLTGVIPHLKYKLDKDFRKKGKKAVNAMFRQLFKF